MLMTVLSVLLVLPMTGFAEFKESATLQSVYALGNVSWWRVGSAVDSNDISLERLIYLPFFGGEVYWMLKHFYVQNQCNQK